MNPIDAVILSLLKKLPPWAADGISRMRQARLMGRRPPSRVPQLLIISMLICPVACSSQTPSVATPHPTLTLHPPESFSMGKFSSGEFALLQWNNPNQSAVSFELQWRFSDVPYWVHLASTSPGAATHPANGPGHIAPWNYTDYCYRGRAVLGNSASGWSDEFCDYMGAGEPYLPPPWPPAATDVLAEAINEGVRLTWAAVDLRQFGSLDSLVLRRKSTEGVYDIIARVPYGTFEFTDENGSRDYCYRIGTSFKDRGKSVSADVCPR